MASRRPDGQPESEADTRFFDLRESGYTGWIDQDGCATTEDEFRDRYQRECDEAWAQLHAGQETR
ncbi:hypothetical protein LCD36_04635 [Saccharopolyspora sp. 6T]|uniref:hypothetical protein n=1 Tax=Saccharopolyspora sp. 6T TaxID=2877238 RepID=UPI001CD3A4EF|nr:hypothetical protein [Saccharopolyspora sp. 6T]MCA1185739.1 hypothetical protein [Saccharopolyspora sp. 6T]